MRERIYRKLGWGVLCVSPFLAILVLIALWPDLLWWYGLRPADGYPKAIYWLCEGILSSFFFVLIACYIVILAVDGSFRVIDTVEERVEAGAQARSAREAERTAQGLELVPASAPHGRGTEVRACTAREQQPSLWMRRRRKRRCRG